MAERIERRSRYLRDFAAAVSHELKTPISGIKGAIELLEEHPEMKRGGAPPLPRQCRRRCRPPVASAPPPARPRPRRHGGRRRRARRPRVEGPALTVVRRACAAPASRSSVELPPACRGRRAGRLIEAVLETLVENSRQAGAGHVAIAGRAERRADCRSRLRRRAGHPRGRPRADLRAVPHQPPRRGRLGPRPVDRPLAALRLRRAASPTCLRSGAPASKSICPGPEIPCEQGGNQLSGSARFPGYTQSAMQKV